VAHATTATTERSWGRQHNVDMGDPPSFTPRPPRFVNIQTSESRVWNLRAQALVPDVLPADMFTIAVIIQEGIGSDTFTSRILLVPNDPPLSLLISAQNVFVDMEVDVASIAMPSPRLAQLGAWVAPFSREGLGDYMGQAHD